MPSILSGSLKKMCLSLRLPSLQNLPIVFIIKKNLCVFGIYESRHYGSNNHPFKLRNLQFRIDKIISDGKGWDKQMFCNFIVPLVVLKNQIINGLIIKSIPCEYRNTWARSGTQLFLLWSRLSVEKHVYQILIKKTM